MVKDVVFRMKLWQQIEIGIENWLGVDVIIVVQVKEDEDEINREDEEEEIVVIRFFRLYLMFKLCWGERERS